VLWALALTFDICVVQHGNVICTGGNTKLLSKESKTWQHWKEACISLLYIKRPAMNESFVSIVLTWLKSAANPQTIK
jgi:hypothetical protein